SESTLSQEEIIDGTVQQSLKEKDSANPLEQPVEVDDRINGCDASISMENGIHQNLAYDEESIDELRQLVIELSFQNEYLKSEIGDLKLELCKPKPLSDEERQSGPHVGSSEQDSSLHEQIKCLQKEIQAQKETQKAAEDALEHLRMSYSDADGKAQKLTTKLIEEKDVGKEKDDLEAHFSEINMKFEQASSQQAALAQQELERSRQQANEALRLMDVERQQLRTANSK
ncbi:hypothetical protein BHE74_00044650, partial [Ensete ventricosum]